MSDSFRFDGIEQMEAALRAFARQAEDDVTHRIRSIVGTLTYQLVMETPQYSGAAASAWRVGIGAPNNVTDKPEFILPGSKGGTEEPYSRKNRNPAALIAAMYVANATIGRYIIGQGDVYITNGLDYALWFEEGKVSASKALRSQNMPHRTVGRVLTDYIN